MRRRHVGGKRDQRLEQDVRQNEAEGRRGVQRGMVQTRRLDAGDATRQAVGGDVGCRRLDRHGVHVRGDDRPRKTCAAAIATHPGAAADIGDRPGIGAGRGQPLDRQQTARVVP